MSLETYTHNPTTAQAIQVAKPWSRLQAALPFAHQVKKASGALSYLILSKPGEVDVLRAYPGDWVVKFPNGALAVLDDEQFQFEYSLPSTWEPIPGMTLAEIAKWKEAYPDADAD